MLARILHSFGFFAPPCAMPSAMRAPCLKCAEPVSPYRCCYLVHARKMRGAHAGRKGRDYVYARRAGWRRRNARLSSFEDTMTYGKVQARQRQHVARCECCAWCHLEWTHT